MEIKHVLLEIFWFLLSHQLMLQWHLTPAVCMSCLLLTDSSFMFYPGLGLGGDHTSLVLLCIDEISSSLAVAFFAYTK